MDRESRPLAFAAPDFQMTSHGPSDFTRFKRPDTEAAGLGRDERLEKLIPYEAWRHSRPAIGDGDFRKRDPSRKSNLDRHVRRAGTDHVLKEMDNKMIQSLRTCAGHEIGRT